MKFKKIFSIIKSLPWTIYVNFRYLPFEQAIRLPIILFSPRLVELKGRIIISSKKIRFGMIQLGEHIVSIYPDNGITLENKGGVIDFSGTCVIGSNSYISVGDKGKLELGDDLVATSSLKIVCYHYVSVSSRTRFGWDCMLMDTGFHPLKHKENGEFIGKAYGPIKLGTNNWFANGTLIMKNTVTAEYCTFGARSVLLKNYESSPYSLYAGSPARVVKVGVYRDMDDCTEVYSYYDESN
ncbi:acyltransferase [Photobacterium ganghwense]|uniref:acyltransferase n=1 Tax=Photobacterium ganghwense TaxID=320778 RepID=UPI004057AC54